jgi:plastocyanin
MRYLPKLAVLSAVLAGAGLAAVATSAAPPATVEIRGYEFAPQTLTVTAGTTVTWINEDETPHTVSEGGRAFRSAALDTGERFSHVFATPGEFTYICTLHPMMVGTVIVKPAASGS